MSRPCSVLSSYFERQAQKCFDTVSAFVSFRVRRLRDHGPVWANQDGSPLAGEPLVLA